MTGENGDIPVEITPHTGSIQVLLTRSGNIVAIIDDMGYVRAIKNLRNSNVQVQSRHNRVMSLLLRNIRQYGLIFNERISQQPFLLNVNE